MHLLKVVFHSEKTDKQWVLSRMSDVPYINGINIQHICKTKKFIQTGLTDFRAHTTMFPNAVYKLDDDISTEIWSFLDRRGFNEVVKDAISPLTYIKEIWKTIKNGVRNTIDFYVKKKIVSLLSSLVVTIISYYTMSGLYPQFVIYSLLPISIHLAVYFSVKFFIMCYRSHKKIKHNIYKGRLHND